MLDEGEVRWNGATRPKYAANFVEGARSIGTLSVGGITRFGREIWEKRSRRCVRGSGVFAPGYKRRSDLGFFFSFPFTPLYILESLSLHFFVDELSKWSKLLFLVLLVSKAW